ncbi:hypothetical protein [Chromobacterium rhizoryzae]|uniref:hypothetical protein n=1 Tax=Chromobacterium rhizoryzae TaxID=1778675 RepID=UPI0013C35DEE|nr:hypothetical protein [Chromobacterium rhizoryzae]
MSWLQAPDGRARVTLLEYVRGVVYSLSTTKEGGIKEVHVSRILNAFAKLGKPSLYRVGLKLLALLQEVEPLRGGYWLIAPFRVIEVENRFLFVGAVPSTYGYLGNVTNEGLGRFVTNDVAKQFPQQSIESWMGVATPDPASLIASFRRDHRYTATATINLADLECLKFIKGGPHVGRRFAWVQHAHAVLSSDLIAVCRQKHGGTYRYFSASLRAGKVSAEAPIEQSLPRLMYALSSFVEAPVVARVRKGSSLAEVTIPERLPIEEYRLALLLSKDITRQGNYTTYSLASNLAPALLKCLTDLGCTLETSK